MAPASLPPKANSGGTVTPALESLLPPFLSQPLPKLTVEARVEG